MSVHHRRAAVGMSLLFVALVGHRVWRYGTFEHRSSVEDMPRAVEDAEEKELFLTSGGLYTSADIEANGSQLPSQKFRGFQASHDSSPRPRDRLCPVTRTKANRECTWIIGGREYQFCCPPCIAEFVRLARENPAQIQSPDSYIQESPETKP